MVRCLVRGRIHLIFSDAQGISARLRQCAINGRLNFERGNCATVELDGCAIACPETSDDMSFGYGSHYSPQSRIAAHRCYFESVNQFTRSLPPGSAWRGGRNYYRFASTGWQGTDPAHGLLQWQAYTGSPETGSVEADSPLRDPRLAAPVRFRAGENRGGRGESGGWRGVRDA